MSDPRPFYHRFAWAYDLLLNEPIGARIAAIVSLLGKRDARPCDEVLDAGCGTGRFASELAGRGFRVLGIDSSAEMVEVALKRPVAANLKFSVGRPCFVQASATISDDSLSWCAERFPDPHRDRERVTRQFARLRAPGGVLLLDVRDWLRTVDRYRARPRTIRAIDLPDGGRLPSVNATDGDQRNLPVS
jgi:SAM-dependent methyltransferase